jgi:hypothetical protein
MRTYGGLDKSAISYQLSKANLFVNHHINHQPLVIIGIDRPETFNMVPEKVEGQRYKIGKIVPRID